MKAKQIFLYLIIIVLSSCKSEEQPPFISYVFSDVSVDAKQTSATITCRNESVDDDKVHAGVLLSKNENITDATKYPLRLQNDTLHCTINGLERNTMYYFCFEVSTANEHKCTDEVHHFETTGGESVTVTTSEAINITQNGATGGGNVTADANYEVSMRGVCWDTVTNPNALVSPHLVSGQGAGTFLVNITGLNPHTTYYMKAYAVCNDVVYYGNEVSFTTKNTQLPMVTTGEVCNITRTSAQANGYVTTYGGAEVTRRGVCWSTAHEPSIGDDHTDNGTGTGAYTVDITDLTPNTTYFVRAYAVCNDVVYYGNEVGFTTLQMSSYMISVSTSPTDGGTVVGGGIYQQGQSCTVTAIANAGYTFTNWTENGVLVSVEANYSFVVTGERDLVANFSYSSGEGSGTADDPYNVAAGIGLQNEEPIAWVHGYIVGAVKSGLSSVTSNADINWSAPFDLATNVVIADDVTCREISQCIIVNLPAGKPLRTQVNLMDNPVNLGKHLAVNGKLRKYLNQAGLRDSNGTEADFVLEGGVTPPPSGQEIFSETFANGQGEFTIQDVPLPGGLTYVWYHSANFSCMVASAYVGQAYAAESWLVSPAIDLSNVSAATLKFDQAVNHASPNGLSVMVSTNYAGEVLQCTWTELNLSQWPAGTNWAFITSTADLTPYVGQTVTIAFKYTSSTSASATWEVKDFVVED